MDTIERTHLLEMLRDIAAHAKQTEETIETFDDPFKPCVGFKARDKGWQISLSRIKADPVNDDIFRMITSVKGRAELAAMLTQGTFPGA